MEDRQMNHVYKFHSKSPEESHELAIQLGSRLRKGDVITLAGDLGAGKTSFTKGLAKGLGVTRNVNSPTFTIMKEYEGRLPFYHMDAYRIEDEFEDLGLDEYFHGDGVSVVEWPSMIEEQLPEHRLAIQIDYLGERERTFSFLPLGEHYIKMCEELFNK